MLQASTTRVCQRACARPDHEVAILASLPRAICAAFCTLKRLRACAPRRHLRGHREPWRERPLNARGTGSSREGGVVHATVPLPSEQETLSGAAEDAAPFVARHTLQLLAPQEHLRAATRRYHSRVNSSEMESAGDGGG